MSIRADFEKEFNSEEYEILVLIKAACRGAMCIKDMLKPSVDFWAAIDLRTGTLLNEKGRIEWLVSKDEKKNAGWGYDFEQLGIYRILVRKCIPRKLGPYQMELMNNRYMLIKILEENVTNESLEKLKEYYNRPILIKNELGEFKLDREFSMFEGCIDWYGREVTVFLETDTEDGDSADKAVEALSKLNENLSECDMQYRAYATGQLTQLANEWQQEEDDEAEEISEEIFAKRIKISEVTISSEGELTLYYNDDDMFWGHAIEILVDADGSITSADIVG